MKLAFAGLAAAAILLAAAPALANSFPSFEQKIAVGEDGTLTVQETAKVNFTDIRHGIYRDIPVRYRTEAGNPFNLRVKVLSVADELGVPLPYENSRNGEYLRVKIGDPNQTVTGRHAYVLTYSVSRALLYLDDHDELYWNVVTQAWGDLGWPQQVSAAVSLPGQVAAADIRMRCFTGLGVGAPEDCAKSTRAAGAQFAVDGARPLTVVVGWPKGIVAKPSAAAEFAAWLADNWYAFIPVIVFVVMFAVWFRKGRDPKPQGPLVVQYEPPEGANPAEVGTLFDQRANVQELTATIVHLAVRGYLKIVETEEKKLLGTKSAYAFVLNKAFADDASLTAYERIILHGIFLNGAVGERKEVSDLANKFYREAAAAKKQMAEATVSRGWFAKSPTAVRAAWMGAGGAAVFISFWFMHGSAFGPAAFVSLILPGIIIAGFGYFMPARTAAGTTAYAQTLGFREYLSKAETARIKWEERENIFEKFLPYAMIFGVVDKWAKAFEGMDMQPPSWYQGSAVHAWTPLLFVNSLNSATSSIGHALMTAPSARGGGGFGGGGGGGGGFGGGGGGSW